MSQEQPIGNDDEQIMRYAEHTRKSLIARLQNWEDQKTWDEFYRTYWRLIYSVALKSGLKDEEAWDVVQETILAIAKQSRKQMYDPAQGSFKQWLCSMTRWRIKDQFRRRKKDTAMVLSNDPDMDDVHPLDNIPDESRDALDQVWEREWQLNLLGAALERVKALVSPLQYQIFDAYVVKGKDTSEVKSMLGVSIAQVYLAKHRVGRILKKQLEYLKEQEKDHEEK